MRQYPVARDVITSQAASIRERFRDLPAWCAGRGVSELPATPETVAAFLASEVERGIRSSTIGRRVAALRYAHKLAGLPLPTDDERVRATVRGIRRTTGTAAAKKAPVTAERLLAMVDVPGCTLAALRDRALLLLGFAGAFRRSELVALDVADFEETSEGLKITLCGVLLPVRPRLSRHGLPLRASSRGRYFGQSTRRGRFGHSE
jgi:site-specific recombinase XerD